MNNLLSKLKQVATFRGVLSIGFLCVCLAGFIFQASMVSTIYFEYKTTSKIEIASTDELRYPVLVFCVRYLDVLDRIPREGYPWIESEIPRNDKDVHKELSLFTTEQIHNLTPNKSESLIKCFVRSNQTDELIERTGEECEQLFHRFKYISGEDICYMYIPDKDFVYSLTKVTSSLSEVGVVYKVHMSKSFTQAIHLTLVSGICTAEEMVDVQNTLDLSLETKCAPVTSRKYSERIIREVYSGDPSNYFVVQGTIHNITLLPLPYETQCVEGEAPQFCSMLCTIKRVTQRVGRYPFSEIISTSDNMKILSAIDLQNQSVATKVKEIDEICRKECSHRQCESCYTLTDAAEYSTPDVNDSLILVAGVPKSNGLTVKTLPFMKLIEYINHICVSGSIWLGVSVLSAYPLKHLWLKNIENRRGRERARLQRLQPKSVATSPSAKEKWQQMKVNHIEIHPGFKVMPRPYCPCSFCRQKQRTAGN